MAAKKKTEDGAAEADVAPVVEEEFSAAEINAKMAAGLSKEQALEVLKNQKEHDKTKPHDK